MGVAAIVERNGVTRIERHCLVEIADGAVKFAAARAGVAAVVQTDRIGRKPDRFIVVGDGAVVIALAEIGEAATAERRGIFRIEPDRLVVVGDGTVELALAGARDAAVVECGGLRRVALDCLIVVGDSAGDIATRGPFDATVAMGQRKGAAGQFPRADGAVARRHRRRAGGLGASRPIVVLRKRRERGRSAQDRQATRCEELPEP